MNKINFTKEVVFRDCTGTIIHSFNIGDEIEFFCKDSTYYVTGLGGIYFDEAEECA